MTTLHFILGQALTELSREKTSLKQVENHTHQFLKSLGNVESKLTDQINYLTQVSTGVTFLLKNNNFLPLHLILYVELSCLNL